mmetsp:Transcript_101353/g.293112  ORF Transcript_101353/g.293112 Transcript_101353/m.293112 type:complete len:773 (-) Transcript_101353:78-2396(-)
MIFSSCRNTQKPRNTSATLAFHQFRLSQEQQGDETVAKDAVRVVVEHDDQKYNAKIYRDGVKGFSVVGPARDSRPEAICDGMELGRAHAADGQEGAQRVSVRLPKKQWSAREIACADEQALDHFSAVKSQSAKAPVVEQKLIPPGEGWTRYDEEQVVDQRSQVYFVQIGPRAGQYLKRNSDTGKFETVGPPNTSKNFPIAVSAGSASLIKRGVKLDRVVILNDIAKIARLALKFPLSFLDTPACAYAMFQGLRTAESAQWCAENFHKKLLPILAEKIHTYEMSELEAVLRRTLESLDAELMLSTHAFSGCGALLALVLGDKLVVAGVGNVRVVLLPERGPARPVMALCPGDLGSNEELERMREVGGGVVRDGLLFSLLEGLDDVGRILSARHVFEVLGVEPEGPADAKQVKTMYRKLALKVHPDKVPEGADPIAYKRAFARLDSAKDALEAMIGEDLAACRELHRVLRSEVRTRAGAAALLGTEDPDEGEKASKALWKQLERMRHVAPDFARAEAYCREAVTTLRRPFSAEGLARQEALMREGLASSRAMGCRDLRAPHPLVLMKPDTASRILPNGRHRVALLCGATAALPDDKLTSSTAHLTRQPKASALRWCAEASEKAACSSALCIFTDTTRGEEPAAKRQKVSAATGAEGTVRVRHILFAHQQLRQADPMARRQGAAKTAQEAELAALEALEKLLKAGKDPNVFLRMCRELSDCQSAAQPGTLSGDLGWIGRGQNEAMFEDAVFALAPNTFGDLVSTSRGVHIVQRLA